MREHPVRLYTFFAALLVRAIVALCTWRGRFVDYVHSGPNGKHVYMRRYVLTGFMTGDPERHNMAPGWRRLVARLRSYLPNLYLHHMQAPDADDSLHDHPWPWAVSWIVLGGYREERLVVPPLNVRPRIGFLGRINGTWRNARRAWLAHFKRWGQLEPFDVRTRWFRAPALNVLRGDTFHRVASLNKVCSGQPKCPARTAGVRNCLWCRETLCTGTWTLFLAGPRASGKPWGYIVRDRGWVPQKTRHAELEAGEVRADA